MRRLDAGNDRSGAPSVVHIAQAERPVSHALGDLPRPRVNGRAAPKSADRIPAIVGFDPAKTAFHSNRDARAPH